MKATTGIVQNIYIEAGVIAAGETVNVEERRLDRKSVV